MTIVALSRRHRVELAAQPVRAPDEVGGEHNRAQGGEAFGDFLGEALDARAARHQRVRRLADRADLRAALLVAAVMADERVAKAVLDEPGRAVRALKAVAAAAAERQGRVAPAVQEQQGLLAAFHRFGNRALQRRRDPAAARRSIAAQVERGDRRHRPVAEPAGKPEVAVAARAGVDLRFDGRRGGGEHHGGPLDAPAHHRHVAGVVGDPVLLLVGRLVLLVDDDDGEIAERKKQRGARARHHRHAAIGAAVPHEGASPRGDGGMPLRRPRAEPRGEAVEELRREGDLRQEDQGLAAGAQRRRDRLEIHLRLARPRDAFQQGDAEGVGLCARAQRRRSLGLRRGQVGRGEVGISLADDGLRRNRREFERPLREKRVDHGHRAGRGGGQSRLAPGVAGFGSGEHPLARRRLPPLRGTAVANAHARRARLGGKGGTDAHAQDHAERAQSPARDPIDEAAQVRRQARQVAALARRLQPARGGATACPHNTDRAARPQRHLDEVAGSQERLLLDPVGVGLIDGDRDQHVDGGNGVVQGGLSHGPRRADPASRRRNEEGRPAFAERPSGAIRC